MLVSVIWTGYCLVSTRVRIHGEPSPTKAYSRFRTRAVILLVTHNAYSDPGICFVVWYRVKTLLVTVSLQGGLCPNKRLSRVTTQYGFAINAVGDQREKRVSLLVHNNKRYIVTELHTKADLGEGCAPIRRQFGLLVVKTSLPSSEVKCTSVAPKLGIVVESSLKCEGDDSKSLLPNPDDVRQPFGFVFSNLWITPESWNPGIREIFACGVRNTAQKIGNPNNDWNPESKTRGDVKL